MIKPFGAGWYLACFSKELLPGQVLAVDIAGIPLVAFRTEAGTPVVLARFCPHMGASLAGGCVVGETIRCAFHQWRFDESGTCVDVPGADKIPPAAKAKHYPTVERYAGVWVFVGVDQPFFDLPSERDAIGDGYFLARTEDMGIVNTTARDVLENALDAAHVEVVHQVKVPQYDVTEWSESRVVIDATIETVGGLKSASKTHLVGPGLWLNHVAGGLHLMPFCLFVFPTPIDERTTRIRSAVYIKGNRMLPWELLGGKAYAWLAMRGPTQDVKLIWRDKKVLERPALTALDGNIMRFRRWYSSFEERWGAAATPA